MKSNIEREAELKQKIESRKMFIEKVIKFVLIITRQKGRVIHYNQGSSNTHIKRALENFGGFSFVASIGETMMGGNTVKVWQDKKVDEIPPVFWVRFEDYPESIEIWTVHKFLDEEKWQSELLSVIRRKKQIISRIEAEEKKEKAKHAKKHKKDIEIYGLEQEAKKLKLL
jgi:hypothetical protein